MQVFAVVAAASLAGCGNRTARAPNPSAYDWPDGFAYRVQEAARTERDTAPEVRYEASKEMRFAVRDDGSFTVTQDSVRDTVTPTGGQPSIMRSLPEDTLEYYVRLSRWGEILEVEPGCDPSVAECRDALPSTLQMELRRIIPRLPVWWPPKGHAWGDTLLIDDSPRPRGRRGALTTEYRSPRDTVVGGRAFWMVTWRSVWRSGRGVDSGAMTARPAIEESAVAYVDKERQIPALVEWLGELPPSPDPLGHGATRTRVRGRAVLVGSVFDSLRVREVAR